MVNSNQSIVPILYTSLDQIIDDSNYHQNISVSTTKERNFSYNTNWIQKPTKNFYTECNIYIIQVLKQAIFKCIIVWLTMFMRLTIHINTLPRFLHNFYNSSGNLQTKKQVGISFCSTKVMIVKNKLKEKA